MRPTLRMALAVILIGIITLCGIFVVSYVAGRTRLADLTQNKLYTLSEGTRSILAKLNQPVTLKLFYSRVAARKGPEQIRYWNNYYLYVRDLLEEYVARSGGKLTLQVIDPRPFSDEEEEALRYGIRRFQLSEDEAFFFGLAATTQLGKDQAIEFFEPERQEFVEYDVSKILGGLMQREKKKIGVIADVPVLGSDMSPYMMQMLRMQGRSPEPPWTIVEQLRQNYEVDRVKLEEKDTAIPSDIDYLMVVHPKNLDEKTRFAIDQFVMKGGKLLVFTDPHCVTDEPQMPMGNRFQGMDQKAASDLNGLLEKWGVKMQPDTIAVDRSLAVSTQMDRSRPPVKFPAYLNLTDSCTSTDVAITANLHSVRMLFPGVLAKVDGAGTEVQPLLQTSALGSTWKPSSPFELRMPDPETIANAITDGTQPILLAALITGKFKTNFPNGLDVDVPAEDKDAGEKEGEEPKAAPPEAKKETPPAKAETKAAEKKAAPAKAEKAAPPKDEKAAKAPPPKAEKAEGAKGEPGKPAAPAPKADAPKAGKAEPKKAEAPKPEPKAPAPKVEAPKAKAEPPKPAPKAEPAKKEEPKEEAKAEEPKKEEQKKRHLDAVTQSAEGARVIVVADVDIISDILAYQRSFFGMAQVGDNAALLFNMLDYLSGSEDLIHVRTRGRYSRPFKVVEAIEQEADKATAVEVKAIKDKIEKFEKELRELGGAATEENIALLQNEALSKRRTVETEIRKANKELRKLQQTRREKVEALESRLQTWNLVGAPSIILLVAVVLAVFRYVRAKHYAARRAD